MTPSRRIAVYPGSFDPITMGHIDILKRLSPSFDTIIVLISSNRSKNALFTPEERAGLAQDALIDAGLVENGVKSVPGSGSTVTVAIHKGLTVDYVRKAGAGVILRGLRAVTDFEYELVMANMNKKLAPDIETMIVFASPEFYYVSSNTVKEVAIHGGAVTGLVPKNVEAALLSKFKSVKPE